MTEEEYFRKNYPDSCYGDKPLSPYWDFFQSGVEFGERQSEKRIANLESQIEQMKKYIKACWVEENLNDYSSYITNTSDEFRDLVKELNEEIRNGR